VRLNGKAALITGASVGIGSAIARRFAGEGCSLYLVGGRNKQALEKTLAACREAGARAEGEAADVSDLKALGGIFERALGFLKRVDILVNCAGTRSHKPAQEFTLGEVEALFRVNAMSAFVLSGLAARHMLERGGGQILNIGSTAGEAGVPFNSLYCATKGAMHLMAKAQAAELGPKGIRVNVLAPGTTLSEGTVKRVEEDAERARRLMETVPLNRFATPEEIAACAAFMASEEASYMNGAVVLVDGGRLCK
jgi:NAD(P)-dependent dehydrogenase (short-subunit alcohol dehydrogenase family)